MSCHNIRGQATLAERLCDELRVMERRGRWVGSTVGWAGEVTDAPAMLAVKTRKLAETTSLVVRGGSLDDEQASGLAERISS
ncbi:hypothetical protein MTO96_004197 [Rhipicephalus appendiculatus]